MNNKNGYHIGAPCVRLQKLVTDKFIINEKDVIRLYDDIQTHLHNYIVSNRNYDKLILKKKH